VNVHIVQRLETLLAKAFARIGYVEVIDGQNVVGHD
jgi:hypothetical protein